MLFDNNKFLENNNNTMLFSLTEYGKWMDGWETRRKRTAGIFD